LSKNTKAQIATASPPAGFFIGWLTYKLTIFKHSQLFSIHLLNGGLFFVISNGKKVLAEK
jgi:hypothetical protein